MSSFNNKLTIKKIRNNQSLLLQNLKIKFYIASHSTIMIYSLTPSDLQMKRDFKWGMFAPHSTFNEIPIENLPKYEVTLKLCTLYKGVPYGPAYIQYTQSDPKGKASLLKEWASLLKESCIWGCLQVLMATITSEFTFK